MINVNELRRLISKREGPTLEFKQEWYSYKKYKKSDDEFERQRGEMVKDLLSLANGNSVSAGETAYLIFGIGDKLSEDGTRDIVGIEEALPDEKSILDIVNAYCDPPLVDIRWVTPTPILDGKCIPVLIFYPTVHVYETTQIIKTKRREFTEQTVFIRHNEAVRPATGKERDAIRDLKRIRMRNSKNAPPILLGAVVGAMIGAPIAEKLTENKAGSRESKMAAGALVFGGFGALIGNAYKNIIEIRLDWPLLSGLQKAIAVLLTFGLSAAFITIFKKPNNSNSNSTDAIVS